MEEAGPVEALLACPPMHHTAEAGRRGGVNGHGTLSAPIAHAAAGVGHEPPDPQTYGSWITFCRIAATQSDRDATQTARVWMQVRRS